MINSKLRLIAIVLVAALSPLFIGTRVYAADILHNVCSSNAQTQGNATCQDNGKAQSDTTGNNAATRIINTAATVVALITGIGAVIYIIIGGFLYVTSGGSSEKTASAKRMLVSAIIGLVVIALAWTLTRFIADHVL